DLDLLRWAFDLLGITVPIRRSSDLGDHGAGDGPSARHIQLCRAVGATTYLSGPGGQGYMDLDQFAEAGVAVAFQDYRATPYPQRFESLGFLADLSVLDALFNCGPAATAA